MKQEKISIADVRKSVQKAVEVLDEHLQYLQYVGKEFYCGGQLNTVAQVKVTQSGRIFFIATNGVLFDHKTVDFVVATYSK